MTASPPGRRCGSPCTRCGGRALLGWSWPCRWRRRICSIHSGGSRRDRLPRDAAGLRCDRILLPGFSSNERCGGNRSHRPHPAAGGGERRTRALITAKHSAGHAVLARAAGIARNLIVEIVRSGVTGTLCCHLRAGHPSSGDQFTGGRMPAARLILISSDRLRAPILSMIRARWTSTVRGLIARS